ncbi:EI24 domain-containing protein [Nitrosomonas sp.]|uniref:EI24 domain-containing protein n=1 Tax=Nitrosomonas sp. TaxID=42353 RepID=UPI00374D9180
MSSIVKATASALRDLMRFNIAWIVIWPILVSTLFWLIISFIFQDSFSELILLVLNEIGVGEWLQNMESGWITSAIQSTVNIILFIPLVIITTLLITAIFIMPALVKLVAKRSFPELKHEYGGTLGGSIINAILASGIFILIWVITMPLWAVGAGIIVPFIAAAFMNQQLFRYDALSEHASKQEIKTICASNRYSLWGLGLLTGLFQFIPILNLLAPIFTALAFIHFGLEHLKLLRAENVKNDLLINDH